jgi:hypothetical protein
VTSSSVNFHEPAVSGTGLLSAHCSFHPGRQWPGSTAHPAINTRNPTKTNLVGDLLPTTMVGDNEWEHDGRMNQRDKPDGMNASQRGRL